MFIGYALPPKPKPVDDLKTSILALIQELESTPYQTKAITQLSDRFGIKRRRLYDVINVYTAIGCCQKSSLDHIIWLGKDKIIPELKKLRKKYRIDDPNLKLDDTYPVSECIGISNLTGFFLLLFFSLKSDKLDIRFAGQFLSRGTGRYKTTLCKLYQISYILSALGVTARSEQVCEVVLDHQFISDEDIYIPPEERQGHDDKIMSLDSLLSRPVVQSSDNYIMRRREEIKTCFINSVLPNKDNQNDGLPPDIGLDNA